MAKRGTPTRSPDVLEDGLFEAADAGPHERAFVVIENGERRLRIEVAESVVDDRLFEFLDGFVQTPRRPPLTLVR